MLMKQDAEKLKRTLFKRRLPKNVYPNNVLPKRCLSIAFVALALSLFSISLTGCRGYHLGNQYLFRSDIRTVHVAMFDSNSDRRFLGQRLTEAVTKQVISSTPLTITERALADSFITGRLVQESKNVTGETVTDEARSLALAQRVEVTWVDRAGTPLMQRQSIEINYDSELIPEGGQSRATTEQEIIDRIAREVVGQMEMPW
jgi:hypothetical protein